jgi:hypothetical protein
MAAVVVCGCLAARPARAQQYVSARYNQCTSVRLIGSGMQIVNSCNVRLTVQFVPKDGSFGGSCDVDPGRSCGTGWYQSEYTAHGGWDTYSCPYGYLAADMHGESISAPHTVYQCKKLF